MLIESLIHTPLHLEPTSEIAVDVSSCVDLTIAPVEYM